MFTDMKKRVVVTGLGVVSSLGNGVDITWERMIKGQSGVSRLAEIIGNNSEVKIAATIPCISSDRNGFDIDSLISSKDQRKMDRFIQLGLQAAKEAVTHANWFPVTDDEKERTATIVGTSLGGFSAMSKSVRDYDQKGGKYLSPFTIPSFLTNLIAGHISIQYGFKGPTGTPTTACVASTQAIGDGLRMIRSGEVDVAVCGGAESCINSVVLASFVASRAVSTKFNDNPSEASRPFNRDRDGFVLGEGAAILVIESLDHAIARGAKPIAEIVGYGTSTDAYHVTACTDNGNGLQRSMRSALRMAGIHPDEIDYINAHGTSTPLGDKSEITAIKEVFGTESGLCVSSTKSSTGHLLGAAGALEAVLTILSLRDGIIPPTLNLTNPDPICEGLNMIGPDPHFGGINLAMSNSAGFGGVNASILLKRWEFEQIHT